MLIVDVLFYLLLYFYLDEVIPNEYGISKNPFFILRKKFWKDIFSKGMGKRMKKQKTHYEKESTIN